MKQLIIQIILWTRKLVPIHKELKVFGGLLDSKSLKKMCGTNEDLLDSYLAEYWWRGLNKTDNIFDAFLRDMKLCFVDNFVDP